MAIEEYRNLVIGSGEGGKLLAWTLARRGEKTAVVERSMIGGSCPNVACLPSKNIIYSAKAAALADPQRGLGVLAGSLRVDMPGVNRRKRQMVDGLIQMHLKNFRESGAELVMGEASFTAPKTVQVKLQSGGMRHLRGERVFLSLGTQAAMPDIPGLSASRPLSHVEALDLDRVPEHFVVLGGGYVGLEFAQAMRRFGSRVTIIQHGQQLLDREDPDVAEAILDLMRDEGIDVRLRTDLLDVRGRSGESLTMKIRTSDGEEELVATDLLVAAGRTPNTSAVAPANSDVELDDHGYIRVNERLETTASDVWALGDCAGSPQFTHVGFDDFRVVLANLSGGQRTTRDRLIPYCLFTDPELAHVGLGETEAKAKGIPFRIARLPMEMVLRTRTLSQTRGFCKAIVGSNDRILGFTAFGAEASEMMAVVQTAMLGNLPYTVLRDAIFTHPTAAEGLVSLFANVAPAATQATR
jgi:pyruvate/2-oxoglutarate dehydrogenase complex dihydrolipoamide dehydrogenase (E3) component